MLTFFTLFAGFVNTIIRTMIGGSVMKFNKSIFILLFVLTLVLIPVKNVFAGNGFIQVAAETDFSSIQLTSFFDLRDRESYVQLTNTRDIEAITHVQIFDVNNNCIENNFYDVYTPNDTHIYNMREIQTNDGNPSGVELPSNAYGFVVITSVESIGGIPLTNNPDFVLIGNFRILDSSGYEYRSNSAGYSRTSNNVVPEDFYFNYNTESGVTLSDVVGISFDSAGDSDTIEVAVDPVDQFVAYDVDIFDLNEVPFSCRNVIFSCIDQDNPRLEELLENSGDASVASFEYGINNAIPHSKGGELLCPGNVINNGIVRLNVIDFGILDPGSSIFGFVGLNNGNGRGSMDGWLSFNTLFENNL